MNEKVTRLFLIRHGEVISEYNRVFAGRTDIPLSENGMRQAVALTKYLEKQNITAVYSSPMKRVQQTLLPFINAHPIGPIVTDELIEIDFGDWTGLNFAQVQEKYGVSAYSWLELIQNGNIPRAETYSDLIKRVGPTLDKILLNHNGESIAIFCHGGIIRVILALLLEIPLIVFGKVGIDYASVTRVDINNRGASLRLLNYLPWAEN